MNVITRFAPSPTGALHIGSARTALFNFIFAKQNKGKFILRIEDTDKERSKKEYEKDILDGLQWLGIEHDEIYHQSEREEIYEKYIQPLLESHIIYMSNEKKGTILRFKNPNKKITFNDEVRGDITFNTEELGDFAIARDKQTPLYHLAVVIDDHEMGVTDVIRGEDHISNTARQILLQEAIGASRPRYTHIPLILAPDRTKLSKRTNATAILDYKKEGYLTEALINFMALLGWSPQRTDNYNNNKDHNDNDSKDEIFSVGELVKRFSVSAIQKGGAIFDINKLRFINREHLKRIPFERLKAEIEPFLPSEMRKMIPQTHDALIQVIMEKIDVFSDIKALYKEGEFSYFWEQPIYTVEALFWKEEKDSAILAEDIDKLVQLLSEISQEQFIAEVVKKHVWQYATERGRGSVLWPFRFALSGREKSPDPFVIAHVLGKKEAIKRLEYAKKQLLSL